VLWHSINLGSAMQLSDTPEVNDSSQRPLKEEQSFSTSVLKAYAHGQGWSESKKTSVSLLTEPNVPIEDIVEGWKSLWHKAYMHKDQGQARFLKVCREILITENQSNPLMAYHGYGTEQALVYDIYTTIASVRDKQLVQPRSRFRFHNDSAIFSL
jgi:hypothetical protein